MSQKLISDWGKFEEAGGIYNPKSRQQLMGCVQAFMSQPDHPIVKAGLQAFHATGDYGQAKAVMQAYGTSGDFPTSVVETIKKFQLTEYFDTAYQDVFEYRDMLNSRRNGFNIETVDGALSFAAVEEGGKAKLYGMSGTTTQVTLDMYGGGLSWSRKLFDDMEYWTLENNAVEFRNQWWKSKAQAHYTLIDAVTSDQNLTWQAVQPASYANTNRDYDAIRDILTINKACENILIDLKDKGYGVTPNSRFGILAPIQLKSRLLRALPITQQGYQGSTAYPVYNISINFSLMLSSSTSYYVYLPGIKSITADRMNLTIFDEFDPLSYSDFAVGWGRYGAAIGDVEQFQRCATS